MGMPTMNFNQAISSSFKFEIPDSRFKEFNYFLYSCELPGATMSGVETPYLNNAASFPSNRIEYDLLNCIFLVSEDFLNWESIFNWMLRIRKDENSYYEQPMQRVDRFTIDTIPLVNEMYDLILHVKSSPKGKVCKLKFVGAYPTMITPIMFESGSSESMPMMCTTSFRYQYFEVMRD